MSQVTPLPITPPPGVVLTETNRVVEGRYIAPWDKARFYHGRPEKRGGRSRITSTPTSGQPRTVFAWTDLTSGRYIAVGTYRKLYVYDTSFAQNDITPFRLASAGSPAGQIGGGLVLTNPFSTTSGSSIISVAHTSHGVGSGDTVIFTSVQSSVDGIGSGQLTGAFIVTTVADANHYSFDCGVIAGSTAGPGGGTVQYEYEINIGTELGAFGLGWGVGGYGLGTYGTARANSTIVIEPRVWSLDNFGKLLMAAYNGGTLYQFDPTQNQPWPRALVASSDASLPTDARAMFVTPERYVMVLRAGLNVSWCTQGDFTVWTPTTNNTANTRTLTIGQKLVGGRALSPFISMIWSDSAAYLFQWTGDIYVYRSSLAGRDCGLVSPNAVVTVDGIAYWMGPDNFWMYDGSVHQMPNVDDIRRIVFGQLNAATQFQCHVYFNPKYHELEFFYGIGGDTNPTHYISYGILDQVWWPGTFNFCSGTHYSAQDSRPIVGDVDGFLYQLENTNDDNGNVMSVTMTISPIAMQEGVPNMETESILPDFFQQTGTITATVNAFDRLTDAVPMDTDTLSFPDGTGTQGLVDSRVSGRYLGMTLTQSVLGGFFRLGKPVAFIKSIGRRR